MQTKHTSNCVATSVSRTLCFWGEEYSTSSTSSQSWLWYAVAFFGVKKALSNIRALH